MKTETLFDRRYKSYEPELHLKVEDVKEFIQKFIDEVKGELWGGAFMLTENDQIDKFDKKAKEKFGDLIK